MAEYLRLIRRTHLQTSIHYYAHPDTGRRVTMIGTHHVGERAYFAGLRVVIDELEAAGALVHCEGSRLLPCDDPAITAGEQQLLGQLRRFSSASQRRSSASSCCSSAVMSGSSQGSSREPSQCTRAPAASSSSMTTRSPAKYARSPT